MLRLLVALDFSDTSHHVLETALLIADRAAPAELLVMTVISRDGATTEVQRFDDIERHVDQLRHLVEGARAGRAATAGVTLRFLATHGAAADEIASQAALAHVDAIVLGTHSRRGIDRIFLGSVAETVVRVAPCSVLTIKPRRA